MRIEQFKEHLENDLIPFWNKMKDDMYGGFYGFADSGGKPDMNSDKGCILNSRILWFYSSAYMLLRKPELLEAAEHAYRFLEDKFTDRQYGGVFWSAHCDGTPADDTKHTYNTAFAIYGLAAYYRASKCKDALNSAYELYRVIENKCRDCDGYLEEFKRDFTPAPNKKLSGNGVLAHRTMNTLLHVMEAYTELYLADRSEPAGKSIRDILRLFKSKIYNSAEQSCRVFFDIDYNSLTDIQSYGHNIEASRLIDRACDAINDDECRREMRDVINGLAEGAYKNGIDEVSHAMNNETGNGKTDRKKVWWVQAEAVTGFYNAYQLNPKRIEYLRLSEEICGYIFENVIDKGSGEWIENIAADGSVETGQALAHAWKCPYHNGRMCIEMITELSKEKDGGEKNASSV